MLTETLLHIVSFLDYGSLVLLKVANRRFLELIDAFSSQLAVRRKFILDWEERRFSFREVYGTFWELCGNTILVH